MHYTQIYTDCTRIPYIHTLYLNIYRLYILDYIQTIPAFTQNICNSVGCIPEYIQTIQLVSCIPGYTQTIQLC